MIYFDNEKNAYGYEIENYIATTTDENWANFQPLGENAWDIVDGEFVDRRNSENFLKQKRLKEIEVELQELDNMYNVIINQPVEYANGLYYKPKYVQESYVLLFASNIFPVTIWDASELNGISMEREDLLALSVHLKNIAESAFQARKEGRKILLQEKSQLTGQ